MVFLTDAKHTLSLQSMAVDGVVAVSEDKKKKPARRKLFCTSALCYRTIACINKAVVQVETSNDAPVYRSYCYQACSKEHLSCLLLRSGERLALQGKSSRIASPPLPLAAGHV